MPQITQAADIFWSQLFWLLLTFGFTYFLVGRMMVPKVLRTVDDRDAKIAGDLAVARMAREEADRAEEDYRVNLNAARAEAQKLTQAAKEQGMRDADARIKSADADIEQQMAAAEAAIRDMSIKAMAEVETAAADVTSALVDRFAGIVIAGDEAGRAVREAMARA